MKQNYPTVDWQKVDELVRYNLTHQRPQGFFEWKNPYDRELGKKVKERGIVCELVKSLEKDAAKILFSLIKYGENPPDTVGVDVGGNQIGFEVTELVDEQNLLMRCHKLRGWKEWQTGEAFQKIQEILRNKSKKLIASPYTKNILVIHTDEPDLWGNFEEYEIEFSNRSFLKPSHIDEAFLLFSYLPGRETYPYLRLNLK